MACPLLHFSSLLDDAQCDVWQSCTVRNCIQTMLAEAAHARTNGRLRARTQTLLTCTVVLCCLLMACVAVMQQHLIQFWAVHMLHSVRSSQRCLHVLWRWLFKTRCLCRMASMHQNTTRFNIVTTGVKSKALGLAKVRQHTSSLQTLCAGHGNIAKCWRICMLGQSRRCQASLSVVGLHRCR